MTCWTSLFNFWIFFYVWVGDRCFRTNLYSRRHCSSCFDSAKFCPCDPAGLWSWCPSDWAWTTYDLPSTTHRMISSGKSNENDARRSFWPLDGSASPSRHHFAPNQFQSLCSAWHRDCLSCWVTSAWNYWMCYSLSRACLLPCWISPWNH